MTDGAPRWPAASRRSSATDVASPPVGGSPIHGGNVARDFAADHGPSIGRSPEADPGARLAPLLNGSAAAAESARGGVAGCRCVSAPIGLRERRGAVAIMPAAFVARCRSPSVVPAIRCRAVGMVRLLIGFAHDTFVWLRAAPHSVFKLAIMFRQSLWVTTYAPPWRFEKTI